MLNAMIACSCSPSRRSSATPSKPSTRSTATSLGPPGMGMSPGQVLLKVELPLGADDHRGIRTAVRSARRRSPRSLAAWPPAMSSSTRSPTGWRSRRRCHAAACSPSSSTSVRAPSARGAPAGAEAAERNAVRTRPRDTAAHQICSTHRRSQLKRGQCEEAFHRRKSRRRYGDRHDRMCRLRRQTIGRKGRCSTSDGTKRSGR